MVESVESFAVENLKDTVLSLDDIIILKNIMENEFEENENSSH